VQTKARPATTCPTVNRLGVDDITDDDQPRYVARFGAKFDAQGVLAGSKDSARASAISPST